MKIHNTIDRAKWRFGGCQYDDSKGDTFLLNDEGFKCCLGFRALNYKCVDLEDILNEPVPYFVNKLHRTKLMLGFGDSVASKQLSQINDDDSLNNEQRENKIIYTAKTMLNENWTFTGQYPRD